MYINDYDYEKYNFILFLYHYRVKELMGYEVQELIEKTIYQYIHYNDQQSMSFAHKKCKYHLIIIMTI